MNLLFIKKIKNKKVSFQIKAKLFTKNNACIDILTYPSHITISNK